MFEKSKAQSLESPSFGHITKTEQNPKALFSALRPTPTSSAEACCLSGLERCFLLTASPKAQHPLPVAMLFFVSLRATDP